MGDELTYVAIILVALGGLYVIWWGAKLRRGRRAHPPVLTEFGEFTWDGEAYSTLRFHEDTSFRIRFAGEVLGASETEAVRLVMSGIDRHVAAAIDFAKTKGWPQGWNEPSVSVVAVSDRDSFGLVLTFGLQDSGFAMTVNFRMGQPRDVTWDSTNVF